MKNSEKRRNSKNISFEAGNSNKKKNKTSSSVKKGKNSISIMEKKTGRKGKDLISPKTIDYSKSKNYS